MITYIKSIRPHPSGVEFLAKIFNSHFQLAIIHIAFIGITSNMGIVASIQENGYRLDATPLIKGL